MAPDINDVLKDWNKAHMDLYYAIWALGHLVRNSPMQRQAIINQQAECQRLQELVTHLAQQLDAMCQTPNE